MSRIAVLSDVHGNLPALAAAAADIRRWSPELVWFLGDAVVFGPDPGPCLALLRDELRPSVAIEGNTDRYVREEAWKNPSAPEPLRHALEFARDAMSRDDRAHLAAFRRDVCITIDGVSFHLCHGAPGDDEARLGPDESTADVERRVRIAGGNVVLCGHTHVPWIARRAAVRIVNDGSVGYPFDGDTRGSWCSIEVHDGSFVSAEIHRFEYDREDAIRRIERTGAPMREVLIQRLRTGRP